MFEATVYDLLGIGTLIIGWLGYTLYADRLSGDRPSLISAMQRHREEWMRCMLKRDPRMVDTQILHMNTRSVSLFITISVLILGGLVAVLGALDRAQVLVSGLPFVVQTTRELWEMKVLVLMIVFAYAFFKFVWSLRQFNYTATLLGAAPPPDALDDHESVAKRMGKLLSLAAQSYNRGIRAYYFGLAILSWFLHPLLLVAATVWVVLVIHRREFRSKSLRILSAER